jgi:uncharacterized protein (TIGR02271 family)
MAKPATDAVVDEDGLRGRILSTIQQTGGPGPLVLLEMADGRRLWAPQKWLEERENLYFLPVRTAGLPGAAPEGGGRLVIPVLVETVNVRRRKRVTGGVRVTKHVRSKDEVIEPVRAEETVEVKRVPIDREVEEAPPVRQEGNVTIVPILEEVLVVEKRLVLREELHIIRHRREVSERYTLTLRQEEAEIERLSGEPPGEAPLP